jgi:hypothetical protein
MKITPHQKHKQTWKTIDQAFRIWGKALSIETLAMHGALFRHTLVKGVAEGLLLGEAIRSLFY